MDTTLLRSISRAILAFQPSIIFTTFEDPKKVLEAALDYNPKALYYLDGYGLRGMGSRYEVIPRYTNQSVDPDKIWVAKSHEAAVQLLCNGAGAFRRQVPMVIRKTMDAQKVMEEFHEKHAAFYSNLTEVSFQRCDLAGNYAVVDFGFTYRIGEVKLKMMEQELAAEVDRICKLLFLPGMPLEAKLYLAHNYLCANVDYVDSDRNDLDKGYTQSAYGALIRHRCVCQGFAEAFKRIMDRAGIRCQVVAGQVVGSDEHHAWNIVDLEKEDGFVHMDVTWDAAGQRPQYMYFGKGDHFFDGKRIWPRELHPTCSGRYSILSTARRYVYLHKDELLARGISHSVLDC